MSDGTNTKKPSGMPPEELQAMYKEHGVEFKNAPERDLSAPNTWRTMPREELRKLMDGGVSIPKRGGGFYNFKTPNTNPFLEARKQRFKNRD
ncbi:hypothetical protein BAC1_01593 [uncultured bacterium]|nr:hypothetical protein BAC1_01593 [uncultured bacterium]